MGEASECHFQLEPRIQPPINFWRRYARRAGRLEIW